MNTQIFRDIEQPLYSFVVKNIRIKNKSYFPKYGIDIKNISSLDKLSLSGFFTEYLSELSEDKKQFFLEGLVFMYLVIECKKPASDVLKELNFIQTMATQRVKFAKRYIILDLEREAIKNYEQEQANILFLSKTKKSLQSKLSDLKKRKKPTKASFETYNFFPTNDPIQLCEKEINEISKRLKRKEASLKLEYSF